MTIISLPNAGQSLGQTRDGIRGNFNNLTTTIGVNHALPGAANQGKHNFVEMPVQSAPPATLATEGGLFTQTTSGSSELYYQRDAVATNIQMTKGTPLLSSVSTMKSGTTFLPGGFILKWINVVINANPTTVNFTTEGIGAFPTNAFAAVVTININSQSNSCTVNSLLANTVDVYTTNTGKTHFLFIIGN